jgi:dihydrofolate synthase / folylpolyglutamate synthase
VTPVWADSSRPVAHDHSAAALADWLARIEKLHAKPIDLGLERVRTVWLRLLGRQPETSQLECPSIVVAGTNGKGSTCAMLDAILRAAGFRVGCYTQPHLLRFNERARIDGVEATDGELIEQFDAVEAARGAVSLTYFEFTTLAILRWFAQQRLDCAILEVGLGGRLDAVNIIDADCAIVTSIDIDHRDWLGDTRSAIALEKAHVYRPGRPAVCSDPQPPDSLIEHAARIGADLWLFGRDFNYRGDRQQWDYAGRRLRRHGLAFPALRGANQLLNAAGVLAALEALNERLPCSQQAVRQGLASVVLPGRFQVLAGQPAIVVDVAHNPHAAAHLAANLDAMGFFPQTWAICAVLRDKDIAGVLRPLVGRVDRWLFVDLIGERAASRAQTAAAAAAAGIDPACIEWFDTPLAALADARIRLTQSDRIVVYGSFLTVADVLRVQRTSAN